MSGDDSGYVKVHQPETTTTRRRACACYPACVLRVCSPLCQSFFAELVLSVGIVCARAPTRVYARARACKGGVCVGTVVLAGGATKRRNIIETRACV